MRQLRRNTAATVRERWLLLSRLCLDFFSGLKKRKTWRRLCGRRI
jgi:hypothetical protein